LLTLNTAHGMGETSTTKGGQNLQSERWLHQTPTWLILAAQT